MVARREIRAPIERRSLEECHGGDGGDGIGSRRGELKGGRRVRVWRGRFRVRVTVLGGRTKVGQE